MVFIHKNNNHTVTFVSNIAKAYYLVTPVVYFTLYIINLSVKYSTAGVMLNLVYLFVTLITITMMINIQERDNECSKFEI